jgi:hypothetical protein
MDVPFVGGHGREGAAVPYMEGNCKVLSDLNPNGNVTTRFSEIPKFAVLRKRLQWLSQCFMQKGRHDCDQPISRL